MIDIADPARPIVGAMLVIVGSPPSAVTTNTALLVAEPAGEAAPSGPVVAPSGMTATNWVVVLLTTDAVAPFTVTTLRLATDEKPVPKMVTGVPTGPDGGTYEIIETSDEACR